MFFLPQGQFGSRTGPEVLGASITAVFQGLIGSHPGVVAEDALLRTKDLLRSLMTSTSSSDDPLKQD